MWGPLIGEALYLRLEVNPHRLIDRAYDGVSARVRLWTEKQRISKSIIERNSLRPSLSLSFRLAWLALRSGWLAMRLHLVALGPGLLALMPD